MVERGLGSGPMRARQAGALSVMRTSPERGLGRGQPAFSFLLLICFDLGRVILWHPFASCICSCPPPNLSIGKTGVMWEGLELVQSLSSEQAVRGGGGREGRC